MDCLPEAQPKLETDRNQIQKSVRTGYQVALDHDAHDGFAMFFAQLPRL
jgi:hypothetical protein